MVLSLPVSQEAIPPKIQSLLPSGDAFSRIMQMDGEVYRDMPGRRTIRVLLGGQHYFIKQHFGVGWREVFKNLLTLRVPIVSALTEWKAIKRLNQLGIPTTPAVAYGCRGNSPANLRSFVMTEDLGDIVSLETLCADWQKNPPDARFKRRLILAVAQIARTLHDNGLNHRDFYLCHFCLDKKLLALDKIHLYLIDLHRVGIRPVISSSARMKDIAGLYFSALNIGLTQRDCLRFLHAYVGSLHDALTGDGRFLQRVDNRTRKLYYKFHGFWPVTPFD